MDAKTRLDSLTGLRFAAALAVAFTHMPFLFGPQVPPTTARILADGFFGVTFFFVLSGFVLAFGYRDRLSRPTRHDVGRYYVARIARVWPVHLLTLAVVVLFLPVGKMGTGPLIANTFLVHAWIPDLQYIQSYNAVSWTLSLEASFYLVFPLMMVAAGRVAGLRWGWFVLAAVACWVVPALWVWWHAKHIGSWTLFLTVASPPARVGEFAVGVMLGLAFVRGGRGGGTPSRARLIAWTVLEALVVVVFWQLLYHSHRVSLLMRLNGYYTPGAALVVWVFAHQRGLISRFWSGRVMTYLGEVSFSFFMIHGLMFHHLMPWLGPGWNPAAEAALLIALALVVSIAVHHTFEMPLRAAVIRWGDRKPKPPASPEPRRGLLARLRLRLRAGNVGRHV